MENHTESPDTAEHRFAALLGARMRAVRHQTGLSLLAVEALSDGEFRSSVLGNYERGEQFISVSRLQRLAQLYNVPVAQLLPPEEAKDTGASPSPSPTTAAERTPNMTIDLAVLRSGAGPERQVLLRCPPW